MSFKLNDCYFRKLKISDYENLKNYFTLISKKNKF